MKKRLAFWNSLIVLIALSAMLSFGILFARESVLSSVEDGTIALTHAYKNSFDGDLSSLRIEDKNVRETIIDKDGVVLWDSEEMASSLPNHLDREEVLAAINGTPKIVIRSSASLGVEYVYYAETTKVGETTYIIRIATKASTLATFLTGYIPWMVLLALIALSLSCLAVYFSVSRSLNPLRKIEMNLENLKNGAPLSPLNEKEKRELGKIAYDIDDVSKELSKAMEELKKEEEKLSLLLESIPNPVLAVGKDERILFANRAAKEAFLLVGKRVPEGFHLEDGAFYKKEGKTYLTVKEESSSYSLFVLNDVTRQTNAEKERKEFVDALSHELKTPLTAIEGFNDLIALQAKDKKTKEYTSKIASSSKRMARVITDMLSLSKLEEKESEKKDAPLLSLRKEAEATKANLSLLAKEKGVTVSIDGETLYPIEMEDASLILKNLIENAILYNVPNGEVKVTLSDGTITVSDTGIGIPKKDQERVFERFYRVDKSRSRENGGTGLGLSIVKHAVLRYGGKISLASTPGYGTTIEIRFPKKK